MAYRYERRALIGIALGAALTAAVIALSAKTLREQKLAESWVSHTREVLDAGLRAADDYQDIPLHSERYVVTRDPAELKLVESASARLEDEIGRLSELTRDNPDQQERVEELRRVARDGRDYNARLRRSRDLGSLRAAMRERPRKPLDDVRRLTRVLVEEEQRLLVERQRRLDRSFRLTRTAFVAACALALAGLIASMLLLLADARRRERAEAALRARTEELARSNRELERFAYVASHDLKEPLRMVISYTQLLERRYKGRLDAEADEFMNFAIDGARRMAQLIDALLEFSRAGRGAEKPQPVDAGACLDEALANLRAALSESGARIERGPLPRVLFPPHELASVFQNLVGNALKFRGERPLVVRVGAERRGEEWVLSVSDNGIGIPPDEVSKLFGLFQRLHTHKRYPGTGLGLAISKRLVEARGGTMWVESRPGEGTTLFFTAKAVER